MEYQAETPFDSIEGSHEYVALLAEALDEARRDVEAEVALAEREGADRRKASAPPGFLQSRQAQPAHHYQPAHS
jgi:hypothetical protein